MKTNQISLQTEMKISASVMEALNSQSHKFWTVHSIFDNGFNLQSMSQIIYISSYKQSLSAHGLLISTDSFESIKKYLRIGNRVQYQEDFFRFFTHPFTFDLKWDDKHIIDLSIKHISMSEDDLIFLIDHLAEVDYKKQCDPALVQKITLNFPNSQAFCVQSVQDMIGMGQGLTPSGDDFIQGMLVGAMLTKNISFIKAVKNLINQDSTTDIAKAYYDSLFQRQINEPWHQLFRAVAKRNQKKLQEAVNNIQSYGASSGYDMLYGVYYYLNQTFY
ncbi:DUF2877 domain-containing protein [Aerococcaceae bacterium DSM 111020]|nr:DUF2877 domain-containing protein [Aerococcaceae bacterium DSM 111020]